MKLALLATHYIPSHLLPALHQSIVALGPAACDQAVLGNLLDMYERREALPCSRLPELQ